MHAAAIMGSTHATVLAVSDSELITCRPDDVLAGHVDRVLFTRTDLLDAGVEWNHRAARFANGSGRLVDELVNDANSQLNQNP
jgi:hypothetical protein